MCLDSEYFNYIYNNVLLLTPFKRFCQLENLDSLKLRNPDSPIKII